jgi:DNA-binding beta-propeller fold protein YncE
MLNLYCQPYSKRFFFLGTAGTANNQVDGTYGVALDSSSSTLYVADYGNNRIMAYSSGASSGSLVAGGNGIGLNNTQLYNPSTVYFDSPSNSLIIANRYAHNIVRWTLGDTQWTLIAGSTNGTQGTLSTLFNTPFGVTLDPMGNVYVADTFNNRIQLFMPGQLTGITIAGTTGVHGNDSDLLWAPYSVVLDSQLNLYVAERDNHRIQKYLRY